MTSDDLYVDALRRLVKAKGSPERVASAAGVSSENLKQIIRGTLLPSGNARGVGPSLRKKLDEAFPGWCEAGNPQSKGFIVTRTVQERPADYFSPEAALRYFAAQMNGMSELLTNTISNALTQLAKSAAVNDHQGVEEAITLINMAMQTKQSSADRSPQKSMISAGR